MKYQAALVLHNWLLDIVMIMLPLITLEEVFVVVTLYTSIRMEVKGGFLTLIILGLSANNYSALKTICEASVAMTEASAGFSKLIKKIGSGSRLGKEDRLMLAACRPIKTVVGSMFTISRETLPTITQDIILGNVINLLLA